jgi:chromosome segregation ATPase
MTRKLFLMGMAAALLVGAASPSADGQSQPQSLGAYARQQRAKEQKEGAKAIKTYTNDNLPYNATISTSSAPAAPPAAPGAEATAQPAGGESAQGKSTAGESKSAEDKKQTKEYWEGRFNAAYAAIASAEEVQHLTEDELSLLQTQRAQALDPDQQAALDKQITDKQAQIDAARAKTDKAKKDLEDLKAEFQDSGAPADWMPAQKPADSGTP